MTSSTNTTLFQRILNSQGTKRLRAIEQARIQRSRASGQRLVHVIKQADASVKLAIREAAVKDVTETLDDLASFIEAAKDALQEARSGPEEKTDA